MARAQRGMLLVHEFSYKAVVDKVSIRDFHATLLHLLGVDHETLIFKHNGLDSRLTGVDDAA